MALVENARRGWYFSHEKHSLTSAEICSEGLDAIDSLSGFSHAKMNLANLQQCSNTLSMTDG